MSIVHSTGIAPQTKIAHTEAQASACLTCRETAAHRALVQDLVAALEGTGYHPEDNCSNPPCAAARAAWSAAKKWLEETK